MWVIILLAKHGAKSVGNSYDCFKLVLFYMSAKVYHTSYSSSSISELISQSSPSQGKRFPAMFDLICIDLIKVHSGTANIFFSEEDPPFSQNHNNKIYLQRVNSSISVSERNESQTLKSVKLPLKKSFGYDIGSETIPEVSLVFLKLIFTRNIKIKNSKTCPKKIVCIVA